MDLDKLLTLPTGTELGTSSWLRVSQDDIDIFGKVTHANHEAARVHLDPVWAREHSPYGRTIVYGFQTLALLSHFANEALAGHGIVSDGTGRLLNYGFDHVRMIDVVPVDAELRGRFTLSRVRARSTDLTEITLASVIEIRNNERPALVADWIFVLRSDSRK
jgi:acyl dehydratase